MSQVASRIVAEVGGRESVSLAVGGFVGSMHVCAHHGGWDVASFALSGAV